jgi:hypothetical protein
MTLGIGAASQLEARLSYLEQLIIIIILGGGGHVPPPRGDPFASDTPRLDALSRLIGRPHGDPFASDIARLSVAEIEQKANEVAAAITKLQGHQVELQARLKELRSQQT